MLAALAGPASYAQQPQPIAEVLADRDGDYVPDRLGRRVTVAGRASVGSGVLKQGALDVFIQDATGGIRLVAPSIAAPVAAGDSVVAVGTLEQHAGLAQLADLEYYVVPGARRVPEPAALDLRTDFLEEHESRLARVEGYVAGKGEVKGGHFLNLVAGDSVVVAFAFASNADGLAFEEAQMGNYVRITGIVAQYDFSDPLNDGYQIYPRRADDVAIRGFSPRFYRNALLVGLLLLVAALGWVALLRRRVRRRVQQLRASEMRYRALFEHSSDAVFVYPLRPGGTPGPLASANRVAGQRLGYAQAALQERTLADLAADAQEVAAHMEHLQQDERAVEEMRLLTAAGESVPFEINSHLVTLGGEPTVLSIARDVTERKRYEDGLIAAKREAESLAQLKSTILANMSHEIRTPLTGIIGFADVLAEEVDDEHREFARTIGASGHRLLNTLNSVLNLSRLDAAQVELDPACIDVAEEISGAVDLLRPMAQKKGLALPLDVPAAPCRAVQDATCLLRVVNNLVGNAIKFTDEGSVRVALEADGDALRLTVQDTGIGMKAAFLPTLFDAFKQESTGLSRSHEGSGLGLAITKRLVELLGGTIGVESEPGVGTTFTVTLPRDATTARQNGTLAEEALTEKAHANDAASVAAGG